MTEKQIFSVQTKTFEGPLELLLDLIEKRKLLINDIALASVTDDYMAYINTIERKQTGETAQFIFVAATLLFIKSKSLLPILELTHEEEHRIDDLEARLKLYQIYAHAGNIIQKQFGNISLYGRSFVPSAEPIFLPDAYTEKQTLAEAIRGVVFRLPKKKIPDVSVAKRKTVSLEDMMKELEQRVTKQFKLNFKSISGAHTERPDVIVSFLAVLELIKQGIVVARQEQQFADFDIEMEKVDTPYYS